MLHHLSQTCGPHMRPQFIAPILSNLRLTINYLTWYPPATLNKSLFSAWSQISQSDPRAAFRWDLVGGCLRKRHYDYSHDLWPLSSDLTRDWLCGTWINEALPPRKGRVHACSLSHPHYSRSISVLQIMDIMFPLKYLYSPYCLVLVTVMTVKGIFYRARVPLLGVN